MTSQAPASPRQDGDPLDAALRALFREADVAPVPPSLNSITSRAMADAATRRDTFPGRPATRLRGIGAALAAGAAVAVFVAVIGFAGWYVTRPGPGAAGAASNPSVAPTASVGSSRANPAIDWNSGLVHLTAANLRIVTAGRIFTANGTSPSIHSDPGDPRYRTLEVIWPEGGVEMRLFIYLAANDTHWWATEIRTYDGLAQGDWLAWYGRFFETPLGGAWSGDLDLTNGVGRNNGRGPVTGDLHIGGMQLTAFGGDSRPAGSPGGATPAPTPPSR
jgi:hypothetical protein